MWAITGGQILLTLPPPPQCACQNQSQSQSQSQGQGQRSPWARRSRVLTSSGNPFFVLKWRKAAEEEEERRWNSSTRRSHRRGDGVVCSSSSSSSPASASGNEAKGESSSSSQGGFRDWVKRKAEESQRRQVPPGEKVMRMVASATSAPVAQYIAEPVTVLHTLDPRVKQAWLLALVILPARAHIAIRFGLVALLFVATIFSLPRRTWQDQLGRMALLSGLLFVFTALGTDGVPPVVHQRTPPPSMDDLPELLPSLTGYSYVLFKLGPLQLTRKGLGLATAAACLSFCVLQSATLCLTTTTPEQLAAGLRWFLAPLSKVGAPVEETILTLLLSLRFLGLVFDEVRNIALAVVARGVQWKSLKLMETIDTMFTLLRRLFLNLLNHAEKISEAMVARGYRGNAANHRIYFFTRLSLNAVDKLALLALALLVIGTSYSEVFLVT